MKALVITTINPPTKAICKYRDQLSDSEWRIIVVGDQKSPRDFQLDGVDYLSIDKQLKYFGRFASLIPRNHYSRKNIGYLYAVLNGAEAIAETDDDNSPYNDRYPNFLPPNFKGPVLEHKGVVNIYSYFINRYIWPRGLPLDAIKNSIDSDSLREKDVSCYIQQSLVDLDPDVDAIYRLTRADEEVVFKADKKLALSSGCYVPFNTQNTLFYKESFPLLLLPTSVSSRVTDIWRGYIAQRLLWSMGSNLLFLSPSVYQIRNPHVLMRDFTEEIPLYTQVHELIRLLESFSTESTDLCENLLGVYLHLKRNKFLTDRDLRVCELWTETIRGVI